jgi:HK97 family phage prohead protease
MIERRNFVSEVRAHTDASGSALVGYAAKFGTRSKPIGTRGGAFVETIKRGAFDRCLKRCDVVATVEHDQNRPLNRCSAGLQLRSDDIGLRVHCPVNMAVSYARDIYENVKNGVVRNMSFAFTMPEDGGGQFWNDEEDDDGNRYAVRTLTDINDLLDVSFVLTPAYDDTEADVRSLSFQFPEGVPALVETRSAGGVIIPAVKQVSESEARRLRMKRLRSTL